MSATWVREQLAYLDFMQHEPKSLTPYEDAAFIIREARQRFAAYPAAVKACKTREFATPDDARVALASCLAAITERSTELTCPQVGKRFGVSPDTVRLWIWSGKLQARNVGKTGKRPSYRISEAALEAMEKVAAKPETTPPYRPQINTPKKWF